MKFLFILVCIGLLTSCQSSNLGKTCERFGMQTQYVDVTALDHDIDGKGFIQTKFHCVPKTKLKSER
jgi:hypothetical protein